MPAGWLVTLAGIPISCLARSNQLHADLLRNTSREIEGKRNSGRLSLMADREAGVAVFKFCHGTERHLFASG